VDFTYLTRLLDSYVNDKEVAGVSACIIKDGKQIYRKNFGYADKENKIFMQDNTIYRMFSMTKPVTAAGSTAMPNVSKSETMTLPQKVMAKVVMAKAISE